MSFAKFNAECINDCLREVPCYVGARGPAYINSAVVSSDQSKIDVWFDYNEQVYHHSKIASALDEQARFADIVVVSKTTAGNVEERMALEVLIHIGVIKGDVKIEKSLCKDMKFVDPESAIRSSPDRRSYGLRPDADPPEGQMPSSPEGDAIWELCSGGEVSLTGLFDDVKERESKDRSPKIPAAGTQWNVYTPCGGTASSAVHPPGGTASSAVHTSLGTANGEEPETSVSGILSLSWDRNGSDEEIWEECLSEDNNNYSPLPKNQLANNIQSATDEITNVVICIRRALETEETAENFYKLVSDGIREITGIEIPPVPLETTLARAPRKKNFFSLTNLKHWRMQKTSLNDVLEKLRLAMIVSRDYIEKEVFDKGLISAEWPPKPYHLMRVQ
jgi:hypothetical protein